MLLIGLNDGVILVRMTWYTDDSVPAICDDIVISIVCRNVLTDGNHTNDNNTPKPSSSLSGTTDAMAVA